MTKRKPEPPEPPPPEPPEHLSERSKAIWRDIVLSRARSAERRVLLVTALESLDRAEECRQILAVEGLTTTTKTTGALHINPLLRAERDNRQLFASIWDRLGLNFNAMIDGRL